MLTLLAVIVRQSPVAVRFWVRAKLPGVLTVWHPEMEVGVAAHAGAFQAIALNPKVSNATKLKQLGNFLNI